MFKRENKNQSIPSEPLPALLSLFHTGFQIIEKPDIHRGRANADFGQGFYLSDNEEFSKRWASSPQGMTSYLNRYELNTEGLKIKRFTRSLEWFDYIFANRAGRKDQLSDYDAIIGPIANDTIYDTYGILTSGFVKKDKALKVLQIGNEYTQLVIKSEKASANLKFKKAEVLLSDEIEKYQTIKKEEERLFQEGFQKIIGKLKF